MDRERGIFRERRARSAGLAHRAGRSLLFGVPVNWMTERPGDHPVFIESAAGARLSDVEGNEYVDFCLGGAR